MKKILALVLAVAMLSTVAFAASVPPTQADKDAYAGVNLKTPDSTILTLGMSDFVLDKTGADSTDDAIGGANFPVKKYDFTSENFSVSVKYKKGADLVKSVAFDDDENVVKVKTNASTSLLAPNKDKAANLVIEYIKVKSKRVIKSNGDTQMPSGKSFVANKSAEALTFSVGYVKNERVVTDDFDLATANTTDNTDEGTTYFPYTTWKADGNTQVGTTTYSVEDMTIAGKVYAGDKTFLKIVTSYNDAIKDIAKANDEAEISAYRVTADGLSASHNVTLNVEKDMKVYKLVDGKLAPSGLKWNEDEYAFTGKIRSTTTYLVSDVELNGTTATTPDTTNPDTGANDVVGIAAALAVVSLVAAGAVSLKK